MILLTSDLIKHGLGHSYIASCGNFEREHSEPTDAVLPSAGKSPRRVDEPDNVHGKCSIDRVHDGQFGKGLHHQVSKDNRQNTFTTSSEFVNPYIITPVVKPLDLSIKIGLCPALTNDYETEEHGGRTSSCESTARSDEETCADSTAAEIKSAGVFIQILT
jgi:hypothetical protein